MEGQTYLCWYNFKKSANFDSMGVAKTNNLIFLEKKTNNTATHTTKCSLLCDLSVLFIPLAEAVLHLEEEKVTFFLMQFITL